MLREAVTNVLRHAEATRCEIELAAGEHGLVFRVANDGAGERTDSSPGRRGHGLTNMSARAAAVGGRLSTRAEGDRFELTVRAPLPTDPSAQRASSA
jgi:two-component system sensor histidine kinase DesK